VLRRIIGLFGLFVRFGVGGLFRWWRDIVGILLLGLVGCVFLCGGCGAWILFRAIVNSGTRIEEWDRHDGSGMESHVCQSNNNSQAKGSQGKAVTGDSKGIGGTL
jgi:hypothetical protein